MIDEHQKFRFVDENKNNEFFLEVNWTKDVTPCKVVKFIFPNGEESLVKREHLMGVLFVMGNPSEQKKMIPQTIQKVRWYETVVGVKAKADIKKGEVINFPIKLSLPSLEEEVLQDLATTLKKK
jgi:hypothetical protein